MFHGLAEIASWAVDKPSSIGVDTFVARTPFWHLRNIDGLEQVNLDAFWSVMPWNNPGPPPGEQPIKMPKKLLGGVERHNSLPSDL